MALGVRQQGEIAYLRGVLGLDELEARLAKLEGSEEFTGKTLEERHSRGLANLAELDSYGATPFSPEGEEDPEDQEEVQKNWVPEGTIDETETVQEQNPASEDVSFEEEDVDLDALLDERDSYEEWTVNELKAELSRRGQPVSGTKTELVDRLQQGDNDVRS